MAGPEPACEPGYVQLQLPISPCQNRCSYCCAADAPCKHVLDIESIESVIEDADCFRARHGMVPLSVYLLDEPMNHPDIARVWSRLQEHGYGTSWLATNGGRIAQDPSWRGLLRSLVDSGLEAVHLSVFGLERTHDSLAGHVGAWRNLMLCAERCAGLGIAVEWSFALLRSNRFELPQAHAYAMGIAGPNKPFSPFVFNHAGRARLLEHERPSWAEVNEMGLRQQDIALVSGPVRSEVEWCHLAKEQRTEAFRLHPAEHFPTSAVQLRISDDGQAYAFVAHPATLLGCWDDGLEVLSQRYLAGAYPRQTVLRPDGIMEMGRRCAQTAGNGLHALVSVFLKWLHTGSAAEPRQEP